MGRYTSVVAFLFFLLLQFVQGVILANFLRRETDQVEQWFWLVGDVLLLLFWGGLLLARRSYLIMHDMPVAPLPTMAAAWAIYMVVVFIPRVTWTMRAAGTCLGQGTTHTTSDVDDRFSTFSELTAWEGNAMTVTLAIGSTVMVLSLAVAGYGQHGGMGSGGLDFNLAEAAFSLMDGVEFLGTFWEDDVINTCRPTPVNCSASDAFVKALGNDRRTLEQYICALQGDFGAFILAVVVFSFILPFFALWQFKRKSALLKAKEVIRRDSEHVAVRSMSSRSSCGSEADLFNMDALGKEGSLSVYHLKMVTHQKNLRTERFMGKELEILKAIYILWDLFLINLAGGVIRIILWFRFDRSISALITKNVLAVIFRSINILNDYIAPWYQAHYGDPDGTDGIASEPCMIVPSLRKVVKHTSNASSSQLDDENGAARKGLGHIPECVEDDPEPAVRPPTPDQVGNAPPNTTVVANEMIVDGDDCFE